MYVHMTNVNDYQYLGKVVVKLLVFFFFLREIETYKIQAYHGVKKDTLSLGKDRRFGKRMNGQICGSYPSTSHSHYSL